jgi:hypothetical protein
LAFELDHTLPQKEILTKCCSINCHTKKPKSHCPWGQIILDANRIKKKQCIETGKIAENSKRLSYSGKGFLLGLNWGDGLRCDYQMVEPPPGVEEVVCPLR